VISLLIYHLIFCFAAVQLLPAALHKKYAVNALLMTSIMLYLITAVVAVYYCCFCLIVACLNAKVIDVVIVIVENIDMVAAVSFVLFHQLGN
jgi:hypothetical protein